MFQFTIEKACVAILPRIDYNNKQYISNLKL